MNFLIMNKHPLTGRPERLQDIRRKIATGFAGTVMTAAGVTIMKTSENFGTQYIGMAWAVIGIGVLAVPIIEECCDRDLPPETGNNDNGGGDWGPDEGPPPIVPNDPSGIYETWIEQLITEVSAQTPVNT